MAGARRIDGIHRRVATSNIERISYPNGALTMADFAFPGLNLAIATPFDATGTVDL